MITTSWDYHRGAEDWVLRRENRVCFSCYWRAVANRCATIPAGVPPRVMGARFADDHQRWGRKMSKQKMLTFSENAN
jgi:hypothetical protein